MTPEETTERDRLRREYIASVKANLVGQLDNTYVIGTDGIKRKLQHKAGELDDVLREQSKKEESKPRPLRLQQTAAGVF